MQCQEFKSPILRQGSPRPVLVGDFFFAAKRRRAAILSPNASLDNWPPHRRRHRPCVERFCRRAPEKVDASQPNVVVRRRPHGCGGRLSRGSTGTNPAEAHGRRLHPHSRMECSGRHFCGLRRRTCPAVKIRTATGCSKLGHPSDFRPTSRAWSGLTPAGLVPRNMRGIRPRRRWASYCRNTQFRLTDSRTRRHTFRPTQQSECA